MLLLLFSHPALQNEDRKSRIPHPCGQEGRIILEGWNTGILEYWSTGVMEYWNLVSLMIPLLPNTPTLHYSNTPMTSCWD
jgi:hypothetical protein